ncbi:class I SAM-dependent methyltransferase [Cupriavidus basilensis]|uniref:Class I SAM-dependent methyltransferase n=1 Tax=Cupriavidus basilensis TaxID=68895 RepID=A0ABT6B0P9_9BURK|nr:class I SAM-dependent methyltransferase [Cupriavidus basilensis]MDF3838353.1 class I SAM-dependent methyltransferase [Cupriavidus basilensis]
MTAGSPSPDHRPSTVFSDAAASDYDDRVPRLVPGYALAHDLMAATFASLLPADARLLLAGCGTGNELLRLAAGGPRWRFSALDPSAGMLAVARRKAQGAGCESRVAFHATTLDQMPAGLHDAAVAALVLHFIPDDGGKAAFLSALAQRLRAGGALVLLDYEPVPLLARAYGQWLQATGLERTAVDAVLAKTGTQWHPVTDTRLRALLLESGFEPPRLIFKALGFQAWLAFRPVEPAA